MGVEIEGRLLVATSVETGESIADPFSRTAELRALLDVRIAQITARARSTASASATAAHIRAERWPDPHPARAASSSRCPSGSASERAGTR